MRSTTRRLTFIYRFYVKSLERKMFYQASKQILLKNKQVKNSFTLTDISLLFSSFRSFSPFLRWAVMRGCDLFPVSKVPQTVQLRSYHFWQKFPCICTSTFAVELDPFFLRLRVCQTLRPFCSPPTSPGSRSDHLL